MINLIQPDGSHWPASLILVPQITKDLPSLAQSYDFHRVAPTSAVGTSYDAICGAVGEFLERRHFYNEVKPGEALNLSNMMNLEQEKSFTNALIQTANSTESINSHKFSTSHVYNLFSFKKHLVPSIFVSLNNHDLKNDITYLPSRDTTGCAAHVSYSKALNSAIKELIERQCLLRYWLTKKIKKSICIDRGLCDLGDTVVSLVNRFSASGYLTIYDITIPGLPGYAVLSLYGSKEPSTVNYSAGLCYGYSAKKVIEKSLLELWQTFIFLHYFKIGGYSTEDIDDDYHRHFLRCNKIETYRQMVNVDSHQRIRLSTFLSKITTDKNKLFKWLESITDNLYIYSEKESIGDILIWYIRAFSPDLFLHMNSSNSINNKNSISEKFPNICKNRLSKMVPFP